MANAYYRNKQYMCCLGWTNHALKCKPRLHRSRKKSRHNARIWRVDPSIQHWSRLAFMSCLISWQAFFWSRPCYILLSRIYRVFMCQMFDLSHLELYFWLCYGEKKAVWNVKNGSFFFMKKKDTMMTQAPTRSSYNKSDHWAVFSLTDILFKKDSQNKQLETLLLQDAIRYQQCNTQSQK